MEEIIKKYQDLFEQRLVNEEVENEGRKEMLDNLQAYVLMAVGTILFSIMTEEEKGYYETIKSPEPDKLSGVVEMLMAKFPQIKERLKSIEALKMMDEKLQNFYELSFGG